MIEVSDHVKGERYLYGFFSEVEEKEREKRRRIFRYSSGVTINGEAQYNKPCKKEM